MDKKKKKIKLIHDKLSIPSSKSIPFPMKHKQIKKAEKVKQI
tara:strand:- start:1426 stop:1551 length:126 start_codon:yes stop_codon:yes gene_type:complete